MKPHKISTHSDNRRKNENNNCPNELNLFKQSLNMPRDFQKMAFAVLIFIEGFGLKRMYFQSQNLKTDLSKKFY